MRELVKLTEQRELPTDVASRLKAWKILWKSWAIGHYALGGASVAASAFASSTEGSNAKYLAASAAVLTALIGFMQSERRYFKFVRAWRVLDVAALRYKLGQLGEKELVDAVERGEALITEFEDSKEDVDKKG